MPLWLTVVLLALAGAAAWWAVVVGRRRPSNDRPWSHEVARLARGEVDGDTLTIRNLRDSAYGEPGTPFEVAWTEGRFDLSGLRRVWMAVEAFSSVRGIAHTFLSFEFAEGDALAVSVEARLTEGERYSIWRGLFRSFELAYTVGTERDFVLKRAAYKRRSMLLLPLVTPPDEARALLLDMIDTANRLADAPRFYHSVTDNCTTALANHANRVRPGSLPLLLPAKVMPGLSPDALQRKGWIASDLPLPATRERFEIGAIAREIGTVPDFSQRLRAELPEPGPLRAPPGQ